jgi:flagellar basal body P-ring protein FlgI
MKFPQAWLWCVWITLAGCSALSTPTPHAQPVEETDAAKSSTNLVGDIARPYGLLPVAVEAVALVTGLNGTGSDPAPCPQRSALLEEMQSRGVHNPGALLTSKNTSMVLVHGVLPPGVQKGDHFDVEIRIPARSDTTSLRGGYLLEADLREMAVLDDNRVHRGKPLGLAQGPVMVDPAADAKNDRVALGRGRVLGGGVALKSRDLGLALKPGHQAVTNSARIATAVNKRFYTSPKGVQVGVAKAKTDKYVELTVHQRYKDNINRYVHVVCAIVMQETETEQMERITRLQDGLLDPRTACEAALQLEAIGPQPQTLETLRKGLQSKDLEVRFYAAEALAYLDQREAAQPLGTIARDEPAFRVFALTALSAMADYTAYEQLRDLLSVPSDETRYGAFRALWAMNAKDPLVAGQRLGDQFSYHLLDTGGPPMIHVTHNRRPEVVLFGRDQRFLTPLAANAGHHIMVTSISPEEIAVSKFSVNQADQKRVVSTRVDEVIRAIVELGGAYPDVVQVLQEAKAANALSSRFKVDALPEPGRTYERVSQGDAGHATPADASSTTPTPLVPDLFSKQGGAAPAAETPASDDPEKKPADQADSDKKAHSSGGLLGKMIGFGAN